MIATSAPSTRTDGAAQYHPIVQKLVDLIKANGWQDKFNQTLKNAECDKVEGLHDIKSLDDYLRYINDLLTWVPKQQGDSHSAYKKIVEFYYLLDQEPVRSLRP